MGCQEPKCRSVALPSIGQFAFVIVDESRNEVLLLRDRAGEKPLYYCYLRGNTIIFGSELKAVMSHSGINSQFDSIDVSHFLTRGFNSSNSSIISSIKRLPPANFMKFSLSGGRSNPKQYWAIPDPVEIRINDEALDLELEELLTAAIGRQYQADVPVGILLSGGLDSSIITTLAARNYKNLNTFTAVFPESHQHDESIFARLISESVASNHVELEIRKPTLELIEFLASNFDEPILDSSLIPTYLLSQEVRKFCTVTLGGDGADELFGGYKHYSRALLIQKIRRTIPGPIAPIIASLGQKILPFGVPGNAWFRLLASNASGLEPQPDRMFDNENAKKLFANFKLSEISSEIEASSKSQVKLDLISTMLREDFRTYLPNDILVKLDRYSMLTSLEMRSPFLDRNVIEFAFSKVPTRLKVVGSERKIILNQLGKRILPGSFEFGRKMGFIPPVILWGQTEEWRNFMQSILLSQEQTLFDKKAISQYFASSKKRPLLTERLLTLTMFEIWRQKNLDHLRPLE